MVKSRPDGASHSERERGELPASDHSGQRRDFPVSNDRGRHHFVRPSYGNRRALLGGQTGFNDDPDRDGLKNGVENFFGTNPSSANIGITEIAKSGNTITFRHPQNPMPASDVTATYEWSADLVNFHADGATAAGMTVLFSSSVNDPVSGTTTVIATINGVIPGKLFARVAARQATP